MRRRNLKVDYTPLLATLSANLGSNAGVSAKCFYNSFICEVRIEGKTTTTFPNWGGYRLGILPEKARPKQNIVEYLYESFTWKLVQMEAST